MLVCLKLYVKGKGFEKAIKQLDICVWRSKKSRQEKEVIRNGQLLRTWKQSWWQNPWNILILKQGRYEEAAMKTKSKEGWSWWEYHRRDDTYHREERSSRRWEVNRRAVGCIKDGMRGAGWIWRFGLHDLCNSKASATVWQELCSKYWKWKQVGRVGTAIENGCRNLALVKRRVKEVKEESRGRGRGEGDNNRWGWGVMVEFDNTGGRGALYGR